MKKLKIVALIARNHKDIRESRAARIGESLKMSQEALIANLKRQLIAANERLEAMLDFGPEHTTSLKIKEVETERLIADIQNTKLEIIELEVKLNTANETYADLFSEVEAETEA